MASHGSAKPREEKPHVNNSKLNSSSDVALRRRAQAVINDRSTDTATRVVIRYALEINDPLLPELLRRIDAGERLLDTIDFR